MTNEIDPNTPIELVDSHTKQVLKTGTYKQRVSFRRRADKLDMQYGSYRYRVNVLHILTFREIASRFENGTITPTQAIDALERIQIRGAFDTLDENEFVNGFVGYDYKNQCQVSI